MTNVLLNDSRQANPAHLGSGEPISLAHSLRYHVLLKPCFLSEQDKMARVEAKRVSFSALVLSLELFQQPNMSEGKVASFALAFTLPLAIYVDLCYHYHISHLLNKKQRIKAGSKSVLTVRKVPTGQPGSQHSTTNDQVIC